MMSRVEKLYELFVNRIIEDLKLDKNRYDNVFRFLKTVSYYKLTPYINFVASGQEIKNLFPKLPEIKDNWDRVVFLYRYNIKLSMGVYPYIYLLENTLKTQINNEMTKYFGYDWYKNIYPQKTANTAKTVDYIVKIRDKYLNDNKIHSLGDFSENHVTFGFWVALLQIPVYWDSKDMKLKRLFVNDDIQFLNQVKTNEIYNKLISVNDLRNSISHHSQIIGRKLISKRTKYEYGLWEVYQNIIYLLKHLGCKDIEWMVGDLNCVAQEHCAGNSFEALYKDFAFVHEYEIKAKKLVKETFT